MTYKLIELPHRPSTEPVLNSTYPTIPQMHSHFGSSFLENSDQKSRVLPIPKENIPIWYAPLLIVGTAAASTPPGTTADE